MTAQGTALELAVPIGADLAAEIEKQSPWVSARIREVRVADGGRVVTFSVDPGADLDAERAKVARFVSDMLMRHRPVAPRVLVRRSRGARPLVADPFRELVRRGWATQSAPGRVSLRGPALAVARALDEDCTRIARGFDAVEESHPSLASSSVLGKSGYFAAFPHALSLVTHLVEDYDALERFRQRQGPSQDLAQPPPETLAPFEACLLPALCYQVYAAREGARLDERGAVVTCAGRCFRYESRNMDGMRRLWEFGMREIVCLGDAEAVAGWRQRVLEAAAEQLERWDLEGTIESANDPFFAPARAGRAWWQRAADRKLELRLDAGSGPEGEPAPIACASFNLHERFFGEAFRIAGADGGAASTACAGWGMERWTLACFAQHGFDPEHWPSWLANRVFR